MSVLHPTPVQGGGQLREVQLHGGQEQQYQETKEVHILEHVQDSNENLMVVASTEHLVGAEDAELVVQDKFYEDNDLFEDVANVEESAEFRETSNNFHIMQYAV